MWALRAGSPALRGSLRVAPPLRLSLVCQPASTTQRTSSAARHRCLSSVAVEVQQLDNPLLEQNGLPRFDAVRAEHVEPAVTKVMRGCR
jgi:hypothetical protein